MTTTDSSDKTDLKRHVGVIGLASYFARSFAVLATRSAREAAFIFRIIRPLCAFTVISLMQHQTFGD